VSNARIASAGRMPVSTSTEIRASMSCHWLGGGRVDAANIAPSR
jgi:hypothetical protein